MRHFHNFTNGMKKNTLFTLGHSTQSFEDFVRRLTRHGITAVADVRSRPYHARLQQFNRETMAGGLKAAGIRYVYLGQELGGRRDEASCYDTGQVDYRRVAQLPAFLAGLDRLRQGSVQYHVALLCRKRNHSIAIARS